MISVRHLSKRYGELQVLKDVNCEIEKGEVISIIGPSGTGKSTFLRCINRLETPDGGELFVNGVDVLKSGADIGAVRKKMGMVFQSFNLYSHLMVVENIMLAPVRLLGKGKQESYDRALKLLETVGLRDKATAFPDELSGGQKQRVAIARTLAMDPEIVLFDEPTSALDPTMVSEVLAVIRNLARQGLTMLVVTHEMNFARNVSSRVFYMDEGIIYEDGTPEEIFERAQKEKTRGFIFKIRSFNYAIDSATFDLYEMNGRLEEFLKRHAVSAKRSGKLELIVEELVMNGILPVLGAGRIDIRLNLGYSEADDSLSLDLGYPGSELNPLDSKEMYALIVNRSAEKAEYAYRDGENHIRIRL